MCTVNLITKVHNSKTHKNTLIQLLFLTITREVHFYYIESSHTHHDLHHLPNNNIATSYLTIFMQDVLFTRVGKWPALAGVPVGGEVVLVAVDKPDRIFVADAERTFRHDDNRAEFVYEFPSPLTCSSAVVRVMMRSERQVLFIILLLSCHKGNESNN